MMIYTYNSTRGFCFHVKYIGLFCFKHVHMVSGFIRFGFQCEDEQKPYLQIYRANYISSYLSLMGLFVCSTLKLIKRVMFISDLVIKGRKFRLIKQV